MHFKCLLLPFTNIYCRERDKDSFRIFLKRFHYYIQILFIYKWHATNFNVLFLAYDVMIQYAATSQGP